MSAQSSFLSQTLQAITTTKMREQDKRRRLYEAHKSGILETARASPNEKARLSVFLNGFKQLSTSNKGIWYVDADRESLVKNVTRYLEQSYRDPSVSTNILGRFESNFREKLEQESQRFEFADLYYRLLSEWTDTHSEPIASLRKDGDDLSGSFEHVQRYNLQDLKDKFSNVVFTPLETDEVEIDTYLHSLFEDDHASSLLEETRTRVKNFGNSFKARTTPFNNVVLKQCIQALLTNDLLNDDAKMTLSEFSTHNVVLDEIADVLNLRFSDLDNWSWEADEGMYYEPRRQANGKFRIMMDQDILQALFLHYIAVGWCTELKDAFRRFPTDSRFWQGVPSMTAEEKSRCHYFTNRIPSSTSGLVRERMDSFRETFLLSSLPNSLRDTSDPYGEDKDPEDEKSTGLGIRQLLLRQIATDVIIRRSLKGDVAVVQSDLQWYATGLPHSTLFAVLRFWGVSEDWISFFRKFAEAPLRLNPTPGEDVRIRKRGIPITDAFEKLFGECVLFSMDVAVNRLSDMTLIRFHDDLWLSGDPAQCANAWEIIKGFVKVLGLDINASKTGSIYLTNDLKDHGIAAELPDGPVCMGMLQLSDSGDWTIDQKQVSAHIRQLEKQLGQTTSIISWIQTWNACIGKFFQNTFGKPANCFGQAHVDAILETHATMQRALFPSHDGSVTDYLREQIQHRFGVAEIPDSFFFLPEEFGGLGLQNPFIPFFLLKDQLLWDPLERMLDFHKAEEKSFKEAAEAYAALSDADRERHFRRAFDGSPKHRAILTEDFFTFEEYTAYREKYSPALLTAYTDLMRKPSIQNIHLTNEIKPWFDELQYSHHVGWNALSDENKWIMHLYAGELKGRFGALSIVDRNLLPSGVMKMLKGKKVTWNQILWE
ncbi:hypothetical protein K491DRAFT_696516 [Lophiostoma macrostomum CBS 122681]|uniref:Reverse transcriptase domain-containing protein n=1 Tax=Lophiostoma macrostomum CBS 122681 TaxID=1314788 RepID=A0A6A6SWN2_9PLEO|nr:hypothetical protein K491DRAFT_696516 [Lophiostoma macrostomum CBS 122681]